MRHHFENRPRLAELPGEFPSVDVTNMTADETLSMEDVPLRHFAERETLARWLPALGLCEKLNPTTVLHGDPPPHSAPMIYDWRPHRRRCSNYVPVRCGVNMPEQFDNSGNDPARIADIVSEEATFAIKRLAGRFKAFRPWPLHRVAAAV